MGQFCAVLVWMARPSGVLPMKIALQYAKQARRCTMALFFKAKKETLGKMADVVEAKKEIPGSQ